MIAAATNAALMWTRFLAAIADGRGNAIRDYVIHESYHGESGVGDADVEGDDDVEGCSGEGGN